MTIKQRLLKSLYPLLMFMHKLTGNKAAAAAPAQKQTAALSFYSLQAIRNNLEPLPFQTLQGKYVLLVNTASECGYTAQYNGLEALQQQFPDKLVVLGFPANDFGGQEPANDAQIAQFCQVNFGVSFPLMKKAPVTGGSMQPVYKWLTQPEQNGWNKQIPTWNFCKYLVSPEGQLIQFFPAGVDPLDAAITKHLS